MSRLMLVELFVNYRIPSRPHVLTLTRHHWTYYWAVIFMAKTQQYLYEVRMRRREIRPNGSRKLCPVSQSQFLVLATLSTIWSRTFRLQMYISGCQIHL